MFLEWLENNNEIINRHLRVYGSSLKIIGNFDDIGNLCIKSEDVRIIHKKFINFNYNRMSRSFGSGN
jgi:hypothetical protein